ncbi:hypothetical protein GCM10007989_21710 [Devosia pacifica]|uniref:STAS domain-containing protein n=2 Tax=Devosia pacifica TaxID=1335967 RepID=A0A918S6T6_9HYPH|nr:hypothetical protein GCM10007989_21710 [Devosia pacifica]
MDLDALEGVRETLIEACDIGAVSIDAGAVERVATNGLFLLLSAAESARAHAVSFAIHNPSSVLLAAIDRLGLAERFKGLI